MRAALILLVAIAILICAFFLAWTIASQIVNSDSATGFLVWNTMADGGPWNSRLTPDPSDISKDSLEFVSWWAPGQYIIPGIIHSAGFNWVHSALLATFLSSMVCCLGVWLLARQLQLDPEQSAFAVLLSAAGSGTLHGFGMYWGGDILLAAVAPYIYLTASRFRETSCTIAFVSFFAVCLAGLFCKHGAILVITAALFFIVVESFGTKRFGIFRDARVWLAGIAALLAFACSQWLWVSGGKTPGAGGQVSHASFTSIAFALNGPWLALTSAGSLFSLLASGFGLGYVEAWHRSSAPLFVIGAAATICMAWLGFRPGAPRAWRLAACAWISVAGLLALLYIRGASVSLEERHFRPAVAPIAVALASFVLPFTWRPSLRTATLLFTIAAIALGLAAHARRVTLLMNVPRGPVAGFSQPDLKPETAAKIRHALPSGSTLVVPTPSIALEFPSERMIVTDALFRSEDQISKMRFSGVTPALVIAVPLAFDADGRAEKLRAAFIDIPDSSWKADTIGDWRLWTAKDSGADSR